MLPLQNWFTHCVTNRSADGHPDVTDSAPDCGANCHTNGNTNSCSHCKPNSGPIDCTVCIADGNAITIPNISTNSVPHSNAHDVPDTSANTATLL